MFITNPIPPLFFAEFNITLLSAPSPRNYICTCRQIFQREAFGSLENIDGMFIAYDRPGSSDFALKLGLLTTEKGSIKTDDKMATNLPGVFAAGDCVCDFKQIATAVGQGAIASESIISYIKKKRSQ